MKQTTRLLDTLKKCLKAKGMTYHQLGDALGLSEASIKRLFSEQTFSVKRLEEICDILDLSLYDLAKISADAETDPIVLTVDQETALAENPKLLVFFYLLLSGRDPASIIRDYDVSDEESLRLLLELDRLGLVELHPGNKVRLRTHKNIQWRKDGPIRTRYETMIIREFLNAPFDPQEHRLRFETGKLSDGSQFVMLKKIDHLIREYVELTQIDQALPQEKSHNTGLMIAFRPWVFSMLDTFKR
ncbi:MAG: transcriptional regulator [Desulfobacterales bacterium CG23_combo_of_CG06-09_8_20_14_all_51_8]|nr:MAG: transcriptional regulator [Desulfobacterales bacterium CG23_combo_of_CG06-09_8_20_14_all_51_8]